MNKGQAQETWMPEYFVFCYYYQYIKDVHFYAVVNTAVIGDLDVRVI